MIIITIWGSNFLQTLRYLVIDFGNYMRYPAECLLRQSPVANVLIILGVVDLPLIFLIVRICLARVIVIRGSYAIVPACSIRLKDTRMKIIHIIHIPASLRKY